MTSLSLLSGYDSDASNKDDPISDEDEEHYENHEEDNRIESAVKPKLVADVVASDSDDDESNGSDTDGSNSGVCSAEKPDPTLPSPSLMFSKNLKDGVYTTTFHNEEASAAAALEVHVKMTETLNDDSTMMNKKGRICRMYKKGQCRKGKKCVYSHVLPGGRLANMANNRPRAPTPPESELNSEPVNYDHEFGEGSKEKRKRIGVTNSLLPPKRSMQNYDKLYKA